jgi:hypothetical protein
MTRNRQRFAPVLAVGCAATALLGACSGNGTMAAVDASGRVTASAVVTSMQT